MKRISAILAGALVLAFASPGLAQNPTTHVNGDVDIYVSTWDVDTLADGERAFALTSIATVHDYTRVNGDVDITVYADDVYTKADGRKAKACTFMGSVGAATKCGKKKRFFWFN